VGCRSLMAQFPRRPRRAWARILYDFMGQFLQGGYKLELPAKSPSFDNGEGQVHAQRPAAVEHLEYGDAPRKNFSFQSGGKPE